MFNKIKEKLYLYRKVYLSRYKQIHYAQFGEDVILNEWIDEDVKFGYYVDVGCYHPRKFSNTYFLYKRGWRGINIDLDNIKIEAMNLLRPEDINITAAVSDQIKNVEIYTDRKYSLGSTIVPESLQLNHRHNKKHEMLTKTLNQIIENTKYHNKEIDLLTIDAEGNDFNVLMSLDIDKYKPKIILIESSAKDINDVMKEAIYNFLATKNYKLANWVGLTLFFVNSNKL